MGVEVVVAVSVGDGVSVNTTVGGTAVTVGGTRVAVAGTGVAVAETAVGATLAVAATVGAAVGAGGGVPANVMRPSTLEATGAFRNLM